MIYNPLHVEKKRFQLSQKLNFTVIINMFTYQVIQVALHFLDNQAVWSHVLLFLNLFTALPNLPRLITH